MKGRVERVNHLEMMDTVRRGGGKRRQTQGLGEHVIRWSYVCMGDNELLHRGQIIWLDLYFCIAILIIWEIDNHLGTPCILWALGN